MGKLRSSLPATTSLTFVQMFVSVLQITGKGEHRTQQTQLLGELLERPPGAESSSDCPPGALAQSHQYLPCLAQVLFPSWGRGAGV